LRSKAARFIGYGAGVCSVVLLVAVGVAVRETSRGVPSPATGSLLPRNLLVLGPFSLALIVPAFIQTMRESSSLIVRSALGLLYAAGILCAIVSIYWGYGFVSQFDYSGLPAF
jgi:hypothetical protein